MFPVNATFCTTSLPLDMTSTVNNIKPLVRNLLNQAVLRINLDNIKISLKIFFDSPGVKLGTPGYGGKYAIHRALCLPTSKCFFTLPCHF